MTALTFTPASLAAEAEGVAPRVPRLRADDRAAVQMVADFLDDMAYEYVLGQVGGGSLKLFHAEFPRVQTAFKSVAPFYRLMFTLLCQGHQAEDRHVRTWIPAGVLDAFATTGLLTCDRNGRWSTPGVCVVSLSGLYLVVSLPPQYFTAAVKRQSIHFGGDSAALAAAYASRVAGRRVLDLEGGCGLHALLSAARGAATVVALERDATAVMATTFNAVLNRLDDRITVRHSASIAEGAGGDRFDLVVCAPPTAPMPDVLDKILWESGGVDGAGSLHPILDSIPPLLSDEGVAYVSCCALGGRSFISLNRDRLPQLAADHGLDIRAFVHQKMPIDVYAGRIDVLLDRLRPGLHPDERRLAIAGWRAELAQRELPAEFVYAQLLRIRRTDLRPDAHYVPTYFVAETDSLIRSLGPDL